MSQSVSYYTLEELLVQRSVCISQGLNPVNIQHEIGLVVKELTLAASRSRHPSNPVAEARDIMEASARVFDQDAE